jgi:hypothetical protein
MTDLEREQERAYRAVLDARREREEVRQQLRATQFVLWIIEKEERAARERYRATLGLT